MKSTERYQENKDDDFDMIIMKIKHGEIKCGRYSHRIKVKNKNINPIDEKELFKHAKNKDSE